MKILLIEDNFYKASTIMDDLNSVGETDITLTRSRNAGLREFHGAKKDNKPFDMVITDNYLPIYDNERNTEPYAADIIREIRRWCDETPICVCSSEEFDIDNIDANYTVTFNSSVYMVPMWETVITDAKAYIATLK